MSTPIGIEPTRPPHITCRAFQRRFPTTSVVDAQAGNKYDLMTLFLTDNDYAASAVPDATARFALKLDIQAGVNTLNSSGYVDLNMPYAASFTALLMQERVPVAFRLTPEERAVILSTTIADSDRPS